MGKRGANGKYNKETVARITHAISKGLTKRLAAQIGGISEDTFYTWLNEFSEFSESIKKAQAEAALRNIMLIQQAAKINWQAAAWWLERTFPEEYALKHKIEAQVEGQMDFNLPDLNQMALWHKKFNTKKA